jgi:threonine aldolase
LAAAGLYALENNVNRLSEDHRAARGFAEEVTRLAPWAIGGEIPTNIVVIDTGKLPADELLARAGAQGLKLSKLGDHEVRAVTHLDVTHEDCVEAGKIVAAILGEVEPR